LLDDDGAGRGVGKKARLEEGSKVEANYRGRGKWYPGKISKERSDGTFDVTYDDGESEMRVTEDMIRLAGRDSVDDRSTIRQRSRFDEGDKVEIDFKGRGKFYPGKIAKERSDGTYDVDFDDGESETRVPADRIRLRSGNSRHDSPVRSKGKLEEGMRVEANFQDRGHWLPGKVVKERSDGTYDVDYDNGKSETRLSRDLIRPRDNDPEEGAHRRKQLLTKESAESIRKLINQFQKKSDDQTAFKVFESLDEANPTGTLSKREFKTGLRTMHSKVSTSRDSFDDFLGDGQFDVLMDCLSNSNSKGSINYVDFLLFATDAKESDELTELHAMFQKELLKKERRRLRDLIKQFASCKTFNAGYVGKTEFEKIVRKLLPKAPRNLDVLLHRWDPTDEGVIDLNVFCSWLFVGFDPNEVSSLYRVIMIGINCCMWCRVPERLPTNFDCATRGVLRPV
jgi:hypothetical protein